MVTDNNRMTTTPQDRPGIFAHLRAWWNRPRLVEGGNVALYPMDGRTQAEREEAEIRIMIYLLTQHNTYLY